MSNPIDAKLAEFQPEAITVKLLSTLFNIVPFMQEYRHYSSITDAAQYVPGSDVNKALEIANSEEIAMAIKIAGYLDTSDSLIAGFAGVKNLFSFFKPPEGGRKRIFESDPEQALDAALKAAALSYMIYTLFPGDVKQKVLTYQGTVAGKEAALYFSIGEVALPFADNLAEGSGNLIEKLVDSQSAGMAEKFKQFIPGNAYDQAKDVLSNLTGPLDAYLDKAQQYTGPITEKIKSFMPSGMDFADSATGVAATGVDLMPVWTLLGARLCAEACLVRSAVA